MPTIQSKPRYIRKVIHISALDSPNVVLALAQEAQGLVPSGAVIVPGVIDWPTYQQRLKTWDPVRLCVGVYGQFYEGAEVLLYPPDWLNKAEQHATTQNMQRKGAALGVDTAEGGDSTCWAVADEHGLIKMISLKTPDTAIITGRTLALMSEFDIDANNVLFDQGGGGQEHADRLRYQGYQVRVVSFGESVIPEPVRHLKPWEEKQHARRERFNYKNRRAQMYYLLHLRLDPGTTETPYPYNGGVPFGIPAEYTELRRQLAPMPTIWDEEGRIVMLPKRRKPGASQNATSGLKSLEEILGCSPDEADALVLAVYAMEPGSMPMMLSPMF